MTLLDVIYVNYNSTNCLIHSIETLLNDDQAKQKFHIIVVDNSSKDNPLRLTDNFSDIKLILNQNNVGFGAAINQALNYCYSKYVIFLNPDSFVIDGFIDSSIFFMEKNDHVGIMGPMILDEDGGVQGSARAFPTPLTSLFGRNSPITKMFPNNSITKSNILSWSNGNKSPKEVDWVSGACMVARREAIQAVGGFDKRFFLYWEDADICRRIKDAGWEVVYYPKVQIIHSVGQSSNTRPVFANYQFHKSCHQLYGKYINWPLSVLVPIAGISLMLRFLIAALFNQLAGILYRVRQIQKRREAKWEKKKDKIKILRIISRMNIGGPSIHVKNLTENLDPAKFCTRLITGTVSPGEGDMGYITKFKDGVKILIPELQREISAYRDFMALLKILQVIRHFRPDIVHSHTSKAGTISRVAVLICNLFQKKKIIAVHTFHGHVLDGYFNTLKSNLFRLIERLLAKDTDRIIAISETQKWELSTIYRIDSPKKIDVIKLGFDVTPFLNSSKQKEGLKRNLKILDDTLLIGIIGRMAPIKNHKMFLDSAKLLIQSDSKYDLKFILVGDGEERPLLEKYANEIGLNGHVIFHGWEKDIPMIYADLDILALTSLNEGTPVSVIEAMAASVPVVTTGVGGIKDLLGKIQAEHSHQAKFKVCERGILCPKDDPITFANALKYMIESGYLLQKGRFTEARDYVLKNYSMDRLVNEIESLYERLMIEGAAFRNLRAAGGIN